MDTTVFTDHLVAKRKKPVAPNINVTPMIDVLLVLLIIFMVVAPTKPASFHANVPGKPADDGQQASTDLLMVVLSRGSGADQLVTLNSTPISLPELTPTLKAILDQRADKTVYIKAETAKAYGDVIAVVDAVKGAGAAPIGMQVDFLQ